MSYQVRTIVTVALAIFFVFTRLLSGFRTSRGHRCRPSSPPRFSSLILPRIGFSSPTARRFSSSVANPRSRAFHKLICAPEEVRTKSYASGFELTKLTYYTRLEDNLVLHRGDRRAIIVHQSMQLAKMLIGGTTTVDILYGTTVKDRSILKPVYYI